MTNLWLSKKTKASYLFVKLFEWEKGEMPSPGEYWILKKYGFTLIFNIFYLCVCIYFKKKENRHFLLIKHLYAKRLLSLLHSIILEKYFVS